MPPVARLSVRLVPLTLALAACGVKPGPVQEPVPVSADTPTTAAGDVNDSDAPAPVAVLTDAQIEAIVSADDREPADRKADERRKPVELLRFLALSPGMKIGDIGAGLGYTSELLARAVGPEGKVYGQNPKFVLERFAEEGWSARLAKPIMANTVRLDREFDDPFPPDLRDLDAVVNVMFYHDFEWQKIDRAAHNKGVYEALRPGGVYVIIDHSAAEGAGVTGSKTLHRVEEALVVRELEAAGFVREASADFLRNEDDTRDWNALPWRSEREELSDRFVLKFRKPAAP